MKELKPFTRNKKVPLKSKNVVSKVEKPEEKSPRDTENEKEEPKDEADHNQPRKSDFNSKMMMKMIGQRNSKALTMHQFRLIEEGAATQIQKLVRGGMTRKWYRAYMKRKKFGVPFSGIEINKDPFLRQFAKLNMDLHLDFIRNEEEKEKNDEDDAETRALIEIRKQMENDESVFVYQTIKNKKHKKIFKGAKVADINKNLEKEFLNKGLDAYNDFIRVNPLLNGQEQIPTEEPEEKPEAEGEGEGDKEKEEPQQEEDTKIPQIKLRDGNDFIENPETLEYLQKVKFINIRKRREEGKTDQEILDELDNNDGLDDEQKVLKSILKNTVSKSLEEEPDPNKRRQVKASELAKAKRKGNEGALISSNFAITSGIAIPETQEMKDRKDKEEKDKEREKEWNDVMAIKDNQDVSGMDIGGNIEFKELQSYSREPIVIYKRISSLMIRWIISAGKVFDRHGYYFIPIKIIGSQLGLRNKVIKSTIYLELMKFPKSAIVGKTFETIWPFLLYLLNNWIRHQFNVMGLTDSKELEERIIQRKERKEREILEGKTDEEKQKEKRNEEIRKRSQLRELKEDNKDLTAIGFEEQEAKRYEEILNFSSEIEYDEAYDINDREFMRKRKEDEKKLQENPKQVIKKEVYPDPKDRGDDLKTPFQQFLVEHTVKLPDSNTNQFKLLKNMQAKNYFEINAKELGLDNIVLMNEERRRYK